MNSNQETLSVTEFKATCLQLFDRIAQGKLKRVFVTRRGRTVAVIHAPSAKEDEAKAVHGSMAGMALVAPGFDLTLPVLDEELDAARGRLYR